jgi:methyltransferase (TIGR00027 family)
MADQQLIRNISDTARWVAMYRAMESERPDALFHDPYARRLAGERGEQIASTISERQQPSWAYMARTLNFDQLILGEVARGADMVINLAAGLDTRPYRLELPPNLQWIEVDLPELIAYKTELLRDETPVCRLERIALDLAAVDARRALFAVLSARAKSVVIVSEGLLIYLTEEENEVLANDLAAHENFRSWIIDLVSPGSPIRRTEWPDRGPGRRWSCCSGGDHGTNRRVGIPSLLLIDSAASICVRRRPSGVVISHVRQRSSTCSASTSEEIVKPSGGCSAREVSCLRHTPSMSSQRR